MMKTIYNLLILCVILCSATKLSAQSVECTRDFEVKAVVTASTCMANGVIEVTLEGDLSNLDMNRAEYGLEPIAGTTGTTLLPSGNNILRGVAPGTYTLSVRTFCKEGDLYGRVKELLDIKVDGSYVPLMADFDQERSRKSYKDCATGIIAFNITKDTGYGDLKFHITQAPSGVSLGEVFPTKGTLSGRYYPYTLPDLYPPGQYQIDIDDNCGKSTISFTLGEINALPSISSGYSALGRSTSLGVNCNTADWRQSTPNSVSQPDFYRYYVDKMYEVALVPQGVVPTASDWQVWASGLKFTLPGSYKDFRGVNSLSIFFRVKDCDQHMVGPVATYLKSPVMYMSSGSLYCDYYTYSVSNWSDYDNFWCYPVTLKVTNATDNTVDYNTVYNGPSLSASLQLLYDKQYRIELTDAEGAVQYLPSATTYLSQTFNPTITLNPSGYNCNTFTGSYYFSSSYRCYPVVVDIFKLKDGGDASVADDFIPFDTYTFTGPSGYSRSIEWEYGHYKVEATFEGYTLANGKPYKQTTTRNVVANRPTAYSLSTSSHNTCYEDQLYLYVRSQSPSTSTYFPAGTVFTVVEAPEGYSLLNVPYTAYSSSTSVSFNSTRTPAGKYKVRVDDGCGLPIFVEANLNGGYSARDTEFVVERDGCQGESLKLDGYVTNAGVNQPSYTYFQIISGPKGFDNTVKRYDESILLAADGEYKVGIKTSMTSSCYLKTETITFVKSKPTLKPSVTSSYVCTDRPVGYIIVAGQNGTEPYTYDLLNEDKTPTGAVANETNDGTGRVYFDYGAAGQTFFVRITDACGNTNDQELKLTDLKTQRIVYNTPPSGEYCVGDEIKLNCITLGETTYLWRGPNGFMSTEQKPRLYPATVAMTGYYSVSVMPEFCGESVTDQLYIKVFPELEVTNVSPNQELCVGARATVMSCVIAGGKGLQQYQWQRSSNLTNWEVIGGADRATYTPPIYTKSGTYYYRLQIQDDCKTIFSDPITLDVKACYIMVNPNIRSKVN